MNSFVFIPSNLEKSGMEEKLRESGIDIIGDVSWGTHICQFFDTKEDLTDILVPYFKAGLENNEFCLWITSQPLEVLHQLDQKIIYPHYDFKHLTEKYFEIGMKLNDFSIQLVKYCLGVEEAKEALRKKD